MAPETLRPISAPEIVSGHVIRCRGVRYLTDREHGELEVQIQPSDEESSLTSFPIKLPVLEPVESVHAVITLFRNGMQKVSCPHFDDRDHECNALVESAVAGRDSLDEQSFQGKIFLPRCPYHQEAMSAGGFGEKEMP